MGRCYDNPEYDNTYSDIQNTWKTNKMKQTSNKYIASAIIDGNEVRLVLKNNRYFIHWGEENKLKAQQELLTPKGRKPSQSSAHKKFLEAVKATQYLKFSKL
jgi:hypothetical protein